jgi:hypothetical protein
MSLAGDSILVTPGSGATVATETVNSKEHQVIMGADPDGHIIGSKPLYVFNIAEQVHVNVSNTIHWDLFNADAALLVRVLAIKQKPGIITAVTGVAFSWSLERTTAVGTGGSAQTAWLPDTSQTALDADITCRSKPTGGATGGTVLKTYTIHGEETNASSQMLHMMMAGGVADLIPYANIHPYQRQGILLRQNQGLRCVQVTQSAAGYTGWEIVFTVE